MIDHIANIDSLFEYVSDHGRIKNKFLFFLGFFQLLYGLRTILCVFSFFSSQKKFREC
jgi:hypothetical protein